MCDQQEAGGTAQRAGAATRVCIEHNPKPDWQAANKNRSADTVSGSSATLFCTENAALGHVASCLVYAAGGN
jgi:hypothetical protein